MIQQNSSPSSPRYLSELGSSAEDLHSQTKDPARDVRHLCTICVYDEQMVTVESDDGNEMYSRSPHLFKIEREK